MGKPTGFIEYLRELPAGPDPGGTRPGLERVSPSHGGAQAPPAGRALHGLRHSLLPYRHAASAAWPPAAPSTISFPNGTTWSIAACGRKRSSGFTRPTISPISPAASAPRRAKAPACSASTTRRSPSRTSSIPSPKKAGARDGSFPNRRRSAPARKSPSSDPAPPASAPPPS